MATTTAPRTTGPSRRRDLGVADLTSLRTNLLAGLALLVPLASAYGMWSAIGGEDDFNRSVILAPFDFVLLAVTALWILTGPRSITQRPRTVAGLLAWTLAALACASFIANPSPRGVELGLRVLGAFAIVDTWQALPFANRQRLLGVLLASGSAHAVLGILQSATHSAFGVDFIDFGGPLYRFGSSFAGRGGLTHPYHLAVFLLVALAGGVVGVSRSVRPLPWLAGIAICAAGFGVTYTRAGLLAVVSSTVLLVFLAVRESRRVLLHALIAAALGFLFSALAFGDGWYARYEHTTGGQSDSGRMEQWSDAVSMTADHPVLGVGPGRYNIELSQRDYEGQMLPAHNFVLQVAAEVGVVAGGIALVLACATVISIARRNLLNLLPVLALAPFFLFDVYSYTFATGIVITAFACAIARAAPDPDPI